MGKTSKPVLLLVDQAILDADPEKWKELMDQGHQIEVLKVEGPPIVVAPYAMRMTVAMMKDLPKAIDLLIKGARALQHSPQGGAEWMKGKPKRVANTNKGKRKNSKVKVEDSDGASSAASTGTGRVEGSVQREEVQPVSQTSYII